MPGPPPGNRPSRKRSERVRRAAGVYPSIYQPKAIGLVLALLHHAPTGDARITVSTQVGADRQVTRSADLDIVSQALDRHFLSTQLKAVVKSISELLEFLPAKN